MERHHYRSAGFCTVKRYGDSAAPPSPLHLILWWDSSGIISIEEPYISIGPSHSSAWCLHMHKHPLFKEQPYPENAAVGVRRYSN
jgi:hypothetical protein